MSTGRIKVKEWHCMPQRRRGMYLWYRCYSIRCRSRMISTRKMEKRKRRCTWQREKGVKMVVRLLIEEGADVNTLHFTASQGSKEIDDSPIIGTRS
jgi:hypothetical protein